MNKEKVVEIKEANLTYKDGTPALQKINLVVHKGEFVVITGLSGSGKTSLLKLILGYEKPTDGVVKVFDKDVSYDTLREIGQTFDLIESQTVAENIRLPLRFNKSRLDKGVSDLVLVENVAHSFGVSHLLKKKIDDISKGEQQRVTIARATVTKPKMLIADEPTASLDPQNSQVVFDLLAKYVSDETTVIVTTHSIHQVKGNYRHIVIESGKKVRDEMVQGE